MSEPQPPSVASGQAAVQSACVEALVAANLLAIGVVRDGILRHASPALVRAFGLRHDAMPMPFTELIDERDRDLAVQALASTAEATIGLRALRSDRSRFDVELSVTHATLPDGPAAVVAL